MSDAVPIPVHLAAPAGAAGPRRSLILAGGGVRMSYQAGALRALEEAGLTFAHADGTSGGTFNLAMLFSGLSPFEMCERWRTLHVMDLLSLMPVEDYLKPWGLAGVGSAKGLVDKVYPHLGIDAARIRAATGMAGTFNACEFRTKTNRAIPHDSIDVDILVGAVSLPIFLPPVEKGDALYCDSVWIKDANLTEAVRRGAEEIWLLWAIGNSAEYHGGAFYQYVHMMEISSNAGLFEELSRIAELNERMARGEPSPHGQTRPIVLHVIRPEHPLPLDPELFLGNIDAATLIAMGYADAKRYLAARRPEGVPLDIRCTRMIDSPPGIRFREVMAGGFALGATDPREGERQGERAGTVLTMRATPIIRDLERFIADPAHAGEMVGSIGFPPLGEDLLAKSGAFNLFSPAGRPDVKEMIYELGFEAGGKSYYLAGKKEVKDDPGFDLWKDTTTLFTRLHEGGDASGAVVGAGVLHLKPAELLKLVGTVSPTDACAPAERTRLILRFGRFFLGNLWDSYVAHLPGANR